MSQELEVRESEDYVLPVVPYPAGQVIDLHDERACVQALDDLRNLEAQIAEAKRRLSAAIVDRARIMGVRSFDIPGGMRVEIKGGPERVYDAEAIERELREAGMPESRIREIVKEEVMKTVKAVEAKKAAAMNEVYADIIERNVVTVNRQPSVIIRRR